MSTPKSKPTQWHPLFAELLRPLLRDYYDVQTNVPVGDAPREADILLLRRHGDRPTPFVGLWRHLTAWNVLEFKGPSVSARVRDLALLVELGLGIDRRLNEERTQNRQPFVEPAEVSFWYVARDLGARWRREARRQFGKIEEIEPGLWRSQVLLHPVFLISSDARASEPDSVPLHLLIKRPPDKEQELARLLIEEPRFLEWYGSIFGVLHPEEWKEVRDVATTKRKGLQLDFSALIDDIGIEGLVKALGERRVMETVGPSIVKEMGIDWLLSKMRPEDVKKLKERLK